jgi:sugar/nucleoside kinase (ribokinase family)
LFFCNEGEACAISKAGNALEAFNALKPRVRSVVVTNGPHGAHIRHDGVEAHVPSFPSEPKDLTGAGDMFAGSFLYGITHGIPPVQAARAACYLSHKVIMQVGARLHHGTRLFWDECLTMK